jgi:hypothetical protein
MSEKAASGGYVKLHRAFFQHEIWTSAPAPWCRVALAILANANWRPGRLYDGTVVAAGSFVTSQDHLSGSARVTRQQCRAALAYLSRIHFITISTTKKHTLITLVNWATYQGGATDEEPADEPAKNQQRTKPQPTENQQRTTIEEGKQLSRKAVKRNRSQITDLGSAMRDDNAFFKANLTDITLLREELRDYMEGSEYIEEPDPPQDVVKSLLETLCQYEVSVTRLAIHLRSLPDKFRPGGSNEPEGWSWFYAVVENLSASANCEHGNSSDNCGKCEREESDRQARIANAAKAFDRNASAPEIRTQNEAQAG